MNAKTIPLDAISQYQVLIAPFDVRQGGFTGGLINAITRRGTNQIHGSFFEYHQDDNLVGGGLTTKPFGQFTENQYGGSVGGPLIRDKLHIFLAGEGQARNRPNSGANIGIDPVTATGIHPDSATRFTNIFQKEYTIINLGDLATRFESGAVVTPELLLEQRVVSSLRDGLKVLGDGELPHPLTVRAHKFSKSAVEKLAACGGAAEVIKNA